MEKIYMIRYSLNRIPKNKLQKDLDELLSGDDRFLLKESDFEKYKESVDERIRRANEANRRCRPENYSSEIRFESKEFPDDRKLFIGDSLFILNFFEIKQETIISHHLLNFNNSHSEAEFDEENPALDALESEIDELIYGPKDDFCF